MRPGVSVARMAMQHAVNANLPAIKAASPVTQSAPALVCMQVRLPNGVSIDFGQAPIQDTAHCCGLSKGGIKILYKLIKISLIRGAFLGTF
jgi:hypothetical protein